MTNIVKVTLPKLGESILHATVVQWFKKPGDRVQLDEGLLEVSTDKVNSEIPAPVAGILKEIVAEVDAEVAVGEVLAIIEISSCIDEPIKKSEEGKKGFYSPAVLRLAKELSLSFHDLESIEGTGDLGRLTKKDLENFSTGRVQESQKHTLVKKEGIERVKMSGMRKAIAANMVRSFYEAPHATLVTDVDVTKILSVIQEEKASFFAAHGVKLTVTSFVAKGLALALEEYPLLNSSLDGDEILIKKAVHLGVATSVDQGIMVPVIKNVETLALTEIARRIGLFSTKAREHTLTSEDVEEGSITLTNFGMSGVAMGIPIIRHPEVAIIGIGGIQKKVVVVDEDKMAIRSMVYISLTFDHRVLDGMYGCGFLNALKKHLEKGLSLHA